MDNKYSHLSFKNKNFVKKYQLKKNLKVMSLKTVYLFFITNNLNVKPAVNYTLRSLFFFKLLNFFKFNNYNLAIVLRIFNREYKNLWYIFLHEYNLDIYLKILNGILLNYRLLVRTISLPIKTLDLIIKPATHLLHNDFTINNNISWCNQWKFFKNYLCTYDDLSMINIFRKLRQQKFWAIQFNETTDNRYSQDYSIHFIRVQRRYNKRRYSRVRVMSRTPFFAGISLSSILVASFWNASIKSVDWFTSLIVVIDVNLVLAILIMYFLFRLYALYNVSLFIRKRGKLRILTSLNRLFTGLIITKLFK